MVERRQQVAAYLLSLTSAMANRRFRQLRRQRSLLLGVWCLAVATYAPTVGPRLFLFQFSRQVCLLTHFESDIQRLQTQETYRSMFAASEDGVRSGRRRYIESLPEWCLVYPHGISSILENVFSWEPILFGQLHPQIHVAGKFIRFVSRLPNQNLGLKSK